MRELFVEKVIDTTENFLDNNQRIKLKEILTEICLNYHIEILKQNQKQETQKNNANILNKFISSKLLKLIPNIPMGYGNIICKCKLVDCIYMDQEFLDRIQKDKQEFLCGEYSLGRYAWILEEVEVLDEPIPAKGHLNIWNYDAYE